MSQTSSENKNNFNLIDINPNNDKANIDIEKISKIRNYTISAHIDSGKTTTSEKTLYLTGKLSSTGKIDEKDTQMDWRQEERDRGITIMADATSCIWKGHELTIMDTPGHADFSGQVIACLGSVDFILALVCASSGIEPQTKFVWSKIREYDLQVLVFVNKVDRVGANYYKVVTDLAKEFNVMTFPITLPIGQASDFIGLIDIVNNKVYLKDKDKDEDIDTEVDLKEVIDNLNDYDGIKKKWNLNKFASVFYEDIVIYKSLLFDYVNTFGHNLNENSSIEDIKSVLRQCSTQRKIVLCVCGSAKYNMGVRNVLDSIVDFAPSPLDKNNGKFMLSKYNDYNIKTSLSIDYPTTIVHVFKIIFDVFLDRVSYTRVLSGRVTKGMTLFNVGRNKYEKVTKIVKIHANKFTELKDAGPGEIVGLIGFEKTIVGDTLSSNDKFEYVFEKAKFPEPVVSKAIVPVSDKDEKRLSDALMKITTTDPTLVDSTNLETGEKILSGRGELHLDVSSSMLKTLYGIDLKTTTPRIAYKETITKRVENFEYLHKRQTGGHGQFARVIISIEPYNDGIVDKVKNFKGEQIPDKFVLAVWEGVDKFMLSGTKAKCPVRGIKVYLEGGETHEVDSSDQDFTDATVIAMREAYKLAEPILLEPIMKVSINTPKEHLGVITADIYTRRGKIINMIEQRQDYFGSVAVTNIIEALMPLAHLNKYSDDLLSLSSGLAFQSGMEFDSYQPLPKALELKKVEELVGNFSYKTK